MFVNILLIIKSDLFKNDSMKIVFKLFSIFFKFYGIWIVVFVYRISIAHLSLVEGPGIIDKYLVIIFLCVTLIIYYVCAIDEKKINFREYANNRWITVNGRTMKRRVGTYTKVFDIKAKTVRLCTDVRVKTFFYLFTSADRIMYDILFFK